MSRNQELNQKMRDDRRERILSGALKLFVTRGLAATKIRDIAVSSGSAQGLIYHYFKSKDEIYIELLGTAYEKMNSAALDLEKTSLSPRKKIKAAIERLLLDLDQSENFGWYCLLISQSAVSSSIPREAKEIALRENRVAYDAMERIIQEGQQDGSLKHYDAKEMSLIFWTCINGLAAAKAVGGEDFIVPDISILARLFV